MSGLDLPALQDLARRIAEATGPDRELDVHVHFVLGDPGPFSAADLAYAQSDPERTVRPPAYTASLDATLELMRVVLPGWGYTLRGELDADQAACALWHSRAVTRISRAPTAPLAWLRAVVAAVMAREGGG